MSEMGDAGTPEPTTEREPPDTDLEVKDSGESSSGVSMPQPFAARQNFTFPVLAIAIPVLCAPAARKIVGRECVGDRARHVIVADGIEIAKR